MDKLDKKNIEIVESSSFQEYREEQFKFLEKWQYVESAHLNPKDRFELDKEAYIKHYFEGAYRLYSEYNDEKEKNLIKRLRKNLKEAKHEVWVDYRNYLKTLIKPQQGSKKDVKKNFDFKDFFNDLDIDLITKIQNQFKDSAATQLAMLIYNLKDFKLVEIIDNSKTKAKVHFIKALTGKNKPDMSHINRVLQNDLKDSNGKIHNINYFEVKKKLETILNTKVV
ncbi:MAG: hypothetical protein AB7O47_01525 [Flavobacteriales bacterium]